MATSSTTITHTVAISSPTASSSQAINVARICTHIPITLDLQSSNYSKWRTLFLVTLGKYGLSNHADGTDPRYDDSEWVQHDYIVLSWIYGSISIEILDLVMSLDATTHGIWTDIENMFPDNKKRRIVFLEAEFCNINQGDMTITEYCHKLKTMADVLGDIGQPISNETLVLIMLRGLNNNFATMATLLPMQSPFPTFIRVHSLLLLKETQHKNTTKSITPITALVSTTTSIIDHGNTNDRGVRGDHGNFNGHGHGGRGKGHGRGGHTGQGSGRNQNFTNSSSGWAPFYNPWTGVIHAWPNQWCSPPNTGILGPRPSFSPQAHATFARAHPFLATCSKASHLNALASD
ncbi:uncharacterized protein LOC120270279 [Dioscorea cayenensis subsp. rotundata]|uniref:Uncharacterized protein LOC120270279 n=1 Tax=Dioscorea cayennensis subsp. rotundata TaxID=55577 RepID=A0AB40C0H8_DIOCR|nr:uncharacterized protein LOC120270279 [Dioscorea cayenensis subsp. rotundata]